MAKGLIDAINAKMTLISNFTEIIKRQIVSSYDFNLFPTERTVTGRWTRDGSQTCIGLACSRNHLPPSVGISSPNTQGKKIWGQINLCRLENFTKTNFDLGILKFQFGTI